MNSATVASKVTQTNERFHVYSTKAPEFYYKLNWGLESMHTITYDANCVQKSVCSNVHLHRKKFFFRVKQICVGCLEPMLIVRIFRVN